MRLAICWLIMKTDSGIFRMKRGKGEERGEKRRGKCL
jgi:hypothetical protein